MAEARDTQVDEEVAEQTDAIAESPADEVDRHEVEHMERHVIVGNRLAEIQREMNDKFLEIGMLLMESRRGAYPRMLGYATIEDFIEDKLKISYRTGKYLETIYEVFIERLQAPVNQLCQVGWTKARELLPIINQNNMTRWLTFALDHKTTEVVQAVKQATGGENAEDRTYTSLSVGVFEDEKEEIKEAMRLAGLETGNPRPGYNLARICIDYNVEARARQVDAETVAAAGVAEVVGEGTENDTAEDAQTEEEGT